MKQLFLTLAVTLCGYGSYAQTNTYPSSGNVGIGTTSPISDLQVSGITILSNPSGGNYNENLRLPPSTSDYSSIALGATTGTSGSGAGQWSLIRYPSANNYMFGIRYYNTDYFNILNNGSVGIGTTSPGISAGGFKYLTISSTGTRSDLELQNTSTGTTGIAGSLTSYNGTQLLASVDMGADGATNSGFFQFYTINVGSVVAAMHIASSGNVGIGTTTPASVLDAEGSSTTEWMRVQSNASGSAGFLDLYSSATGGFDAGTVGLNTNGTTPIAFNIGGAESMRMVTGGNLLIGKTSQANTAYKLDINGSARANEVVVNTSGADFVFDNKYTLPKLSEVKSYIDRNHHLPEIPSADEMRKDGLGVGEINTKLLQKVEELTLYAIKQQKRIDQLEKLQTKTEQQDTRIAALEAALAKLTTPNTNK